jgi:hypothetical protein
VDVDGLAAGLQSPLEGYGVLALPEVGDGVAELGSAHMIYAELDVHIVANVLTQPFLLHLTAHTITQKNRVVSADHRAKVAAESHA